MRQSRPTLETAPLDHVLAVGGAHADAEAVGLAALPVVGLVGSFHRDWSRTIKKCSAMIPGKGGWWFVVGGLFIPGATPAGRA
jgi:hypothetical protein